MAENSTESENNPLVTNQEGDEELRSGESAVDGQPSEFVTITIRKHTAVELLNALITNLGGISEPNEGCGPSGGRPLSVGGDSTTDSDR